MLQTMEDMWRMVNTANAAIKDLNTTLNRERAKSELLLGQIEKLNEDNAWLVGSRKRHMDACAIKDAGLRCMSDTISWMTDNQRIF